MNHVSSRCSSENVVFEAWKNDLVSVLFCVFFAILPYLYYSLKRSITKDNKQLWHLWPHEQNSITRLGWVEAQPQVLTRKECQNHHPGSPCHSTINSALPMPCHMWWHGNTTPSTVLGGQGVNRVSRMILLSPHTPQKPLPEQPQPCTQYLCRGGANRAWVSAPKESQPGAAATWTDWHC